jgi:methyl-accepting chemotaxis protein
MMLSLRAWWPLPRAFAPARVAAQETGAKPAGDAALRAGIQSEIARGEARVERRLEEVKTITEREILACGDVLSRIVENARALSDESARALVASSERSELLTSRFIADMQANIAAQEGAVKQVLALAENIKSAMEAINGLSRHSNILAINARIEAARLGERGSGFAVIADEMRELSRTIHGTADKVSAAIGAVRQGLPTVGERAAAMQQRTRAFITEVADEMKSEALQSGAGAASARRLEAVLELSNAALSHLQFHDPMTQQLAAVSADLTATAERVQRLLNGESVLDAVEEDAAPQQAAAGKIILFDAGEDLEPSR